MAKNPPCRAGDTGSIPGSEDPTGLGAANPTTTEAHVPGASALRGHHKQTCTATREELLLATAGGSPHAAQNKINAQIKF